MDIKLKDNNKLAISPFTQLEYIESTGTQYIAISDITSSAGINFEIDVIINKNSTIQYYLYDTGNNSRFGAIMYSNNSFYVYDDDNQSLTCNGTYAKITLIGTLGKVEGDGGTDSRSLYRGTHAIRNLRMMEGTCKVKRVKIYRSSKIIHDYIPVIYNNIVCMYDITNTEFVYNNGTGNFIAGPEISSVITGFPFPISTKINTIFNKNTPNIDGYSLLNTILSFQENVSSVILNRARVDIGNVSGSYSELMRYSTLHGFNDNYEQQTKPRLVGTWTITDWYTSEQLTEAQNTFDGLTVVADPDYLIDFNELAIQVLDDTKPNYNPAVAIKLQSAGYGITLNSPCVNGQDGRWFLKKTSAAAITAPKMNCTFNNVSSVIDSNGIVSNDKTVSYSFSKFNEYKYFIGITHVPDSWFTNSNLSEITLPETIITIDTANPPYYYSGAFAQTKLSYIVFPSNVETLGVGVAYNTNLVFAQIKGNDVTLREFNYLDDPGSEGGFYKTSNICFGNGQKYNDAVLFEHHMQKSKKWSHYGSKLKSWYSYAAPNISYDGTNVTISVGRTSTIYYTTDGSTPSTSSTQYTEPFIWNGIGCIKAMTLDTMYIKGDTVYADDFYASTTQNPVITNTSSQITISAESGATIYYTLDGSHPTLESSTYSGPITVTQEMGDFVKVRCFARVAGKNDSEVIGKICVMDDSKWGTDGDDSYFAVQCMDSTKPNYNPAVCIILDNNGKLTDRCYGGGGYLIKTDAAAIPNFGGPDYGSWFVGKINVSSNLLSGEYSFNEFDEFRFFSGITHVTDYLFRGCTSLESIIFPDSVTYIDSNSPFENCTSLHNVVLNNGLVSIGDSAFSNTGYIEELIIPDTVTTIGSSAFAAARVKKVVLGSSVTVLSYYAFMRNSTLTEFIINNSILTNLGTTTFYNCFSLKITEIPESVTLLKHETFYGCNFDYLHLTSPSLVSVEDNTVFTGSYKIYVGDGSSAAHDDAILASYQAASGWSPYSSRLDTWYNYLHPSS